MAVGIDRLAALADLKMKLRRVHRSALADGSDNLPSFNRRAFLGFERVEMSIGRHPAAAVADQDQVSEAF